MKEGQMGFVKDVGEETTAVRKRSRRKRPGSWARSRRSGRRLKSDVYDSAVEAVDSFSEVFWADALLQDSEGVDILGTDVSGTEMLGRGTAEWEELAVEIYETVCMADGRREKEDGRELGKVVLEEYNGDMVAMYKTWC